MKNNSQKYELIYTLQIYLQFSLTSLLEKLNSYKEIRTQPVRLKYICFHKVNHAALTMLIKRLLYITNSS